MKGRRERRRYHLRLPFWIYCGLTVLLALAAIHGGSNLLFWMFGVMASALLVSGAVSGMMMVRLEVRRITPGHGEVGEPLDIRYAITNHNRFVPAFNIHVRERAAGSAPRPKGTAAWPALMASARAWVMHVGPRETVHGEAIFRPRRRGEAAFDELQIWTSFPFGIIGKSVTLSQPQRMPVYPRRNPLRHRVLEAIGPAGAVGMRISPKAGAGDDFYGLRDFRAGDSLRHIAWKRTANRDQLVCVERTRPNPPKLRVALDLARPRPGDGPPERELEELAIGLAASIIHAADLAGYEVGLTVLGLDVAVIPIRRNYWHRQRIMTALARIDLDGPRRRVSRRLGGDPDQAALVVVHPDRPDLAVAVGDAWHFSARQIDRYVERARGTGPRPPDPGPAPRTEAAA